MSFQIMITFFEFRFMRIDNMGGLALICIHLFGGPNIFRELPLGH